MEESLLDRQQSDFYTDLCQFYRRKWNSNLKRPAVNGKLVDLFGLYQKVSSLGGWLKVSTSNRWDEVQLESGLPQDCADAEHAVKLLYLKYLAKFEQQQLFGEDSGDEEEATSSQRSRAKHYLTSLVPQSSIASSSSNKLPDFMRSSLGLSPRSSGDKISGYTRLIRSLQCGLPNEVDFAINTIILLSNPGPNSLRLGECPVLVDLLLAQMGIFGDDVGLYRKLYDSAWRPRTGRKFVKFWCDIVENSDVLPLLGPPELDWDRDFATTELFNLSTDLDYRDVVSQRVVQIASILRNLSFEASNKDALAKNSNLMIFILVAMHCKWALLQGIALDTLSNIATEIELAPADSMITQLTFKSVVDCLYSDDKFHLIRALETVGNLCASEKNEAVLSECLEPAVLQRIVALISVKDIMLCVYLLECIYQVSELGQLFCQRIAEIPKAVETLLDMITVEAFSFGPTGLAGMKVVQYGPQEPIAKPAGFVDNSHAVVPVSSRTVSARTAPLMATPAPTPMIPAVKSAAGLHPGVRSLLASSSHSEAKNFEPYRPSVVIKTEPNSQQHTNAVPTSKGPIFVHQDEHAEQSAAQWLRSHCLADPSRSVARSDLYSEYANFVQNAKNGERAITASSFANLIKQLFPSCICHILEDSTGKAPTMKIEGIRFNSQGNSSAAVPLVNGTSVAAAEHLSSSIALQHPTVQNLLTKFKVPPASMPSSPGLRLELPAKVKLNGGSRNDSTSLYGDSEASCSSVPSSPDSLASGSGFEGSNPGFSQSAVPSAANSPSVNNNKKLKKRDSNPESLSYTKKRQKVTNGQTTSLQNGTVDFQLDVCRIAEEAKCIVEDGPEAKILRVANETVANGCEAANVAATTTFPLLNENFEAKVNGSEEHLETKKGAKDILVNGKPPLNGLTKAAQTAELLSQILLKHPTAVPSESSTKKPSVADVSHIGSPNPSSSLASNSSFSEDSNHSGTNLSSFSHQRDLSAAPNGHSRDDQTSSPGPDMDAFKQNLSKCQTNIEKLLGTPSIGQPADSSGLENTPIAPVVKVEVDQTPINAGVVSTPTPTVRKVGRPRKVAVPGESPPKSHKKKSSASTSSVKETISTPVEAREKRPRKPYVKKKASLNHTVSDGIASPALSATPGVSSSPQPQSSTNNCQSASTSTTVTVGGASGSAVIIHRIPPPRPDQIKFLCEWGICGTYFETANGLFFHVVKSHLSTDTPMDCQWPHCDKVKRLHWALATHVHDIHCNEQVLKVSALRRYELAQCGASRIPETKSPPVHPGYAQDASTSAIKRHAFNHLKKLITEENEGPVTKSLRLTSSLILRNLSRYSIEGRRQLRRHEAQISFLAFSQLESSAALCQCLSELHSPTRMAALSADGSTIDRQSQR